jgi:hypothetical protein
VFREVRGSKEGRAVRKGVEVHDWMARAARRQIVDFISQRFFALIEEVVRLVLEGQKGRSITT